MPAIGVPRLSTTCTLTGPRTFGSASMSASPAASPSSPPSTCAGLPPQPPHPETSSSAASRPLTPSILNGLLHRIHEQQHEDDEWDEVGDDDDPAKRELVPAGDELERSDTPRNKKRTNRFGPVRLDLEAHPENDRA